MQNKKVKLFALLFLVVGLAQVKSQNVIAATGGQATGSNGSIDYSVGLVVYSTSTGPDGSVSQGVQQPYEISSVIGIEEVEGINLIYSTYPNPTKGSLILKVENYNKENLSYSLYDINGKLLENKKIEHVETPIVMNEYMPATYFLKVISNQKEVKNIKIIKN
jgi:hypothetical protein